MIKPVMFSLAVFAYGWLIWSADPACASSEQDRDNDKINVSCIQGKASDKESQKVINVIELITKALARRDFDAMAQFMDEGCTTFDESSNKVVVGRDLVIADVKKKLAAQEALAHERITDFTIDHPFVRINGNVATVSFVLIKQLSGTPPQKFESHCTDVFIKHGKDWKKLHYRGDDWKLIQ